jgi:hypothetical protein
MNEWQAVYSTIAEVAATLTGLLFVSLSVRLNASSSEERPRLLVVAQRSFFDFLAVLLIALLFLPPGASLYVIGWIVLWLSAARIAWHVSHWRIHRGSAQPKPELKEYLIPMAATLMSMAAGIAMLLAYSVALRLTYATAIVLLIGACQNAWRLLVR